jgi:hypothetical protein
MYVRNARLPSRWGGNERFIHVQGTIAHDQAWPLLASHAVGVLPDRLADQVDAHLVECPRCQGRLEGYACTVDRLAIAGDSNPPELLHMWEGVQRKVRAHRSHLRLLQPDA